MAELIETPAATGLPIILGGATLELCPAGRVTWIAALPGQRDAVSDALKSATGVAFPEAESIDCTADLRAVWVGPDEALVFGDVPQIAGSVQADQSDGISLLRLVGPSARDILMRLVPIDLRDKAFPVCASARTMLAHLAVSLIRTDDDAYEIVVMRSMTRTAIHDLCRAMEMRAAAQTR